MVLVDTNDTNYYDLFSTVEEGFLRYPEHQWLLILD
jgi:hypothetical protein